MRHFHKMGITLLIASMSWFLASCSASGPKFPDSVFAVEPVAKDKARLIFYRDSDANFRDATIAVDDSIIGAVSQHSFVAADVMPGSHKVLAWVRGFFQEFALDISAEAGKTYYMRVSQRIERSFYPMIPIVGVIGLLADKKGEFQITPMPEATALQQLRELRLSE
jgi:hypothetical protein